MTTRPESAATPSGFFMLRTPLMPYALLRELTADLAAPRATTDDELTRALASDRERVAARLRELATDPVVREAVFVASPSLDEALSVWLGDATSPRAQGVAEALLRYVGRMAARATPFGLFSGYTLGSFARETRVELAPRGHYRRSTRLDMHYLSALCDALERDPAVRATRVFRPSTGLYPAAGQLRYAEARTDPRTRARSYHLVSVERSPALDAVLTRAKHGARPSELVEALLASGATLDREEAVAFVEVVIDSQILVSDLAPTLTGDEPLEGVLRALDASEVTREAAARLRSARESVATLDAVLGEVPSRYREVADELRALPAEVEVARLFQVDLCKPAVACELGRAAQRELDNAVRLLARLAAPGEYDPLRRFREAFVERYEGRTVPLAEALDEESGVGFAGENEGGFDPAPLLDGLDFQGGAAAPKVTYGARAAHLARGLSRAQSSRSLTWELDDSDLDALSLKETPELPVSFALLAEVVARSDEAVERGDFHVVVRGMVGPSGANLLGRFCHADPALRAHVEAYLREEEKRVPSAGAVFAEVVHLPEGRLGNILCRPRLRAYEIPYLGRAGADDDHLLPITDLRVTVRGRRVVLSSERLGCEVVPRLTSAHNHPAAELALYRFLCALQFEGQTHAFGWAWGPHASAPFLPRVTRGRLILSLARWNLDAHDLRPLAGLRGTALYRSLQALRQALGLPRFVGLVDGDHVLPLDLDSVLHVESLAQIARSTAKVSLVETLTDEGLVARGPEGGFVHELVVPYVRGMRASPPAPFAAPRAVTVKRTFAPGSEWLYAKLYTGTAGADRVLTELIAPWVAGLRRDGALDRWFFLRYADPRWHVRVRVRADAERVRSVVLPRLHEAVAPWLEDGCVVKVSLDTYEREVERYGGDAGIELAEAVFEADSDASLAIVGELAAEGGADARWRLALRGMHLLLTDFGLDLDARHRAVSALRQSFGTEHATGASFEKQLGAKFRSERASVEALLTTSAGAGFAMLGARSEAIATAAEELRERARAGRLSVTTTELAQSFLHLHANRVLRAEHRAQELVLYDFLTRIYQSERARRRGGTA